jgi:Bacteriophage replication gene A protein (GPA)
LFSDGLVGSRKRHRFDTKTAQDQLNEFGTWECRKFRNDIFDQFSLLQPALIKEYSFLSKTETHVEANKALLKRKHELMLCDLNLASDDSELKLFAQNLSGQCRIYMTRMSKAKALKSCERLASKYTFGQSEKLSPAERMNRLLDRDWWYRKARTVRNQRLSEVEREMGVVRLGAQPYSSNRSIRCARYAQARTDEFMKRKQLVNHAGEKITLADCAKTNTSNPEVRFAELMVRVKGFEEVASDLKHVGVFLTLTTPSRMHRSLSKYGIFNPKFDGTTARQANKHLCRVGARVRASLHRQKITPYGFRVVEPHHDGTPHWHILLFVPSHNVDDLISTYKKYALEDSPNEKGARKSRFKAEIIDPNKGSAAGYVVKYISKNISGKGVGLDNYGNPAIESAERIVSWARDNRIRQFQQIGGPSVSIWRELRRLRIESSNPALESARCAADNSDWAGFVKAMGGPNTSKKEQPIALHYDHTRAVDIDTGEYVVIDQNKYGETSAKTIKGIEVHGRFVPTRFIVWHACKKLLPLFNAPAKAIEKARHQSASIASEARDTWTCVNNCTEGTYKPS